MAIAVKDDNINIIKMNLKIGYLLATEEEIQQIGYPYDVPSGFSLYVFHGKPDLKKTAMFPVKLWKKRDQSVISPFLLECEVW